MTAITSIIFDNDGVNGDTEHVAMGDMAEFGYALVARYIDPATVGLKEQDIYKEYKGMSSDAIIKTLIEKYDLPETQIREDYDVPEDANLYEFLSNLHTLSVINKFENGQLEALPGFVPTIDVLIEKYGQDNIALCTTSRADRMDATVHAVDPVTKDNVNWGEKFPAGNKRVSGYGHANKYVYFQQLNPNWELDSTVVVEDTAGSTKKAIEAGFANVIGIVASKFQTLNDKGQFDATKQAAEIQKLKEAGAKVIVTDYRDLPIAIEWLSNGMDMNNVPAGKLAGKIHHNNWSPDQGHGPERKPAPGS